MDIEVHTLKHAQVFYEHLAIAATIHLVGFQYLMHTRSQAVAQLRIAGLLQQFVQLLAYQFRSLYGAAKLLTIFFRSLKPWIIVNLIVGWSGFHSSLITIALVFVKGKIPDLAFQFN